MVRKSFPLTRRRVYCLCGGARQPRSSGFARTATPHTSPPYSAYSPPTQRQRRERSPVDDTQPRPLLKIRTFSTVTRAKPARALSGSTRDHAYPSTHSRAPFAGLLTAALSALII